MPSAPVGNWLGMHDCQRIVDMMTAAGMLEQALLNAAESGTIPGVSTVEDSPIRKTHALGRPRCPTGTSSPRMGSSGLWT